MPCTFVTGALQVDLLDIAEKYKEKFGSSLEKHIRSDTSCKHAANNITWLTGISGNYRRLLLEILGSSSRVDPDKDAKVCCLLQLSIP